MYTKQHKQAHDQLVAINLAISYFENQGLMLTRNQMDTRKCKYLYTCMAPTMVLRHIRSLLFKHYGYKSMTKYDGNVKHTLELK